ncbi:class IV aminotransferase [Cohaesibacter sp. CAU 1516]|uniref:aminotransferase class IV n=1 Tax=Cohaesibacter sp. CAU 1516 TaxID=2576038 RepID=UPI0010FDFFC9|nr:aminotransferase class IV [Cohaesibacter sp. CAU 1516]TLP48887.1 class IV aminotransferase [Cohaesibacter sp. CAU 1516]
MTDPHSGFTKAVWIDDTLLRGEEATAAKIALDNRGLLLGDGIFETLPILKGAPIWWPEHRNRLLTSAHRLGIAQKAAALDAIVQELSDVNAQTNAILRLTVIRTQGGRGLVPAEASPGFAFASVAPYPDSMAFDCLSLITSAIRKNEGSPSASLKSLNYLDHILAAKEASQAGAGDALMLNNKDKVACTTIGNVFAVFGNNLVTPPPQDGLLSGILRSKVLAYAANIGCEAKEQSLTLDDMKKADGVFLTNSLRIVRRVNQLDDHIYYASDEDIIAQLQALFRRILTEAVHPFEAR